MPDVLPDEGAPEVPLAGIPTTVAVRVLVGNQLVADLTVERPNDHEAQAFAQQLVLEIQALLHKDRLAH